MVSLKYFWGGWRPHCFGVFCSQQASKPGEVLVSSLLYVLQGLLLLLAVAVPVCCFGIRRKLQFPRPQTLALASQWNYWGLREEHQQFRKQQ